VAGATVLDGSQACWARATAFIVVLALAVRVYAVQCAEPSTMWDAGEYRDLAVSLVHDHAYARVGNSIWDDGLLHRAYRPPGYPFMRAALMVAFDEGPYPALWLNVIAEMMALGFVIAAARRATDRKGAFLAALVFAPTIPFVTNQLTESVSMALAGLLMWALLTHSAWRSGAHSALLGATLAIAILTRPISVFWIPALAWHWWASGRSARALAACAAPMVLLLGGWILRNYLVFHGFVWSSTNLGVHNSVEFGIPWARLAELRHSGLDEPSADRALVREVLASAASDPERTFDVLTQRATDLFSVSESNCVELEHSRTTIFASQPQMRDFLAWSIDWLRITHVIGLVGAALVSVQPRHPGERRLVAALVAFVVLQTLISRGDVRLVAPVLPMLSVLGAGMLRRASA
jgi:hypothetical protein